MADDELIAAFKVMKEERLERRDARLAAIDAKMDATLADLAKLGLTLEYKSEFHIHIRRGRELVAQWWPSSGKTMDGQRRGQRCATGAALVSWLKAKQKGAVRRG